VSKQELELPKGWVSTNLITIADPEKNAIVDGPFGSDLKVSDYSSSGTIPVLTIKMMYDISQISEARKITVKKFEQIKRSRIRGGDLLIAKIGNTYGLTCFYPDDYLDAMIPANICKITPNLKIISKYYLKLWLDSIFFKKYLDTIVSSTAQPAFGITKFKKLPIPLPPLTEQKRIVSKIEELFSKIDSTKQSLEQTKLQLELYRQSLLKSAFEGKLTEDWREVNKNRLELIIPENKNYEIMDLHGWISCSIGDLIKQSKQKFEPLKDENKILIGLEHIEKHTGRIIGQDNSKNLKSTKTVFRCGDILYGRLRPYFNKIAIPDFDGVCSTDILVFQETTNIMNKFLKYFLMQGSFVKFTNKNMTGTELPRIGFKKISEFMIQLPSLMEQEQIVSQIEQGFSLIENTQNIVNSTLQTLQTMKMSVLKQAFEGKLVPQDPNDEPAEKLLERIKKEKS